MGRPECRTTIIPPPRQWGRRGNNLLACLQVLLCPVQLRVFVLRVVLFGAHHHYVGGEAPVGQGGDERLSACRGGGLGRGRGGEWGGREGGQRDWRAVGTGGGRRPGVDV